MTDDTRRTFLHRISAATGAFVLAPLSVHCGSAAPEPTPEDGTSGAEATPSADPLAVPSTRPADWDAVAFNRARGNAGAIPESYLPSINGPDGDAKHLGKHLPYVVAVEAPPGFVAIMWGDPSKGHAMHPNAVPTEENPDGHWYNWIRLRKAADGEHDEAESRYSAWPTVDAADSGRYGALTGQDPAADDGKNTVYLAALPRGVGPGDTLRVYAHCLTHGEYVDFVTLPAA